jgi:hypothetical protein
MSVIPALLSAAQASPHVRLIVRSMSVRERRRPSHRAIAIARDIIEIVAILAAGAWAIYTFVYEERIKPAGDPPSVVLTGSLQRLGERDGMVQMGFRATLRDIGHTRVYIIAQAISAVAQEYTRDATPAVTHPFPGVTEYDRSARIARSVTVYRQEEFTRYADPKYKSGFELDPGDQIPYSGIFLVPKRSFDSVTIFGSVAFSKYRDVYPTTLTSLQNGVVIFTSTNHSPHYADIEITLDRATLW